MGDSDSNTADARWFLTTHWSVVQAAGGDSTRAFAAMERLCQTYWYPLYAYARRAGHSAPDAEDYSQAFFLKCLEKDTLSAADQARGRFRSFLLIAFKRFVANEQQKARARKRGGGSRLVELDALEAEERYALEPADVASADKLFERRWAMTLLDRVLERLELEQANAGNSDTFAALKEFLTGAGRGTPHSGLAARLGVTENVVKVTVHRLRKRYRELLNDEIANTVSSSEDIEEERRHLLSALAG
ncbi:MAG: RNA polymerase sigma factor [Limisphaerales bacterium]